MHYAEVSGPLQAVIKSLHIQSAHDTLVKVWVVSQSDSVVIRRYRVGFK